MKSPSRVFTREKIRWLQKLLVERFGVPFVLGENDESGERVVRLSLPGSDHGVLFDKLERAFHDSGTAFSCAYWSSTQEGFTGLIENELPAPVIGSLHLPLVEASDKVYRIHYDILGLAVWMLARVEEIGPTDLDDHSRFPATSSHAFKHGYLERPIVDEWLHILGEVIKRVWPQIELKKRQFEIKVSHDVDAPARYAFQGLSGLVRTMAGDVLRRRDLKSASMGPWLWLNSRKEIHPRDPVNTFDWLMNQSELNGLTSAFYFICGRTDKNKDAIYDPEMPQIRALLRKIHSRGHEIGLHPSYNTYDKPDEIKKEADRLRKVCCEEGINQTVWGGRMHFLRWNQSITQRAWSDAGMTYDTTLGYADRPGFRCGTCHEYQAFDLVTDTALSLRIRPLVAMDCTVIAERYLGLGPSESAYQKFNELKKKCESVGGMFTLLWHNSFFNCDEEFDIYRRLISSTD